MRQLLDKLHARLGDDKAKFWLLLLAFAVIYLLLRLPWITCDPGIPSVWEYGYNATDEGYYLSGGKEKLLWGHFVDLPRTEVFTYGFSPGTHWLSYLAHLALGLSTWTWRIPFLAIYLCAWLAAFCHISKRTSATSAFALCTSVSLVPMVIAYERTASNDALIAAILMFSYVCATGRSMWRVTAAGLMASSIILVKPSVWVLLPIAAAGAVEGNALKSCVKRLAVFLGAAIAGAFLLKLIAALSVLPDAAQAGVSIWEVVRRTTTHYPLPSIFDFSSHFKGLSAFPRDPSIQLLGAIAPLLVAIPFAMATRNAVAKRWNGHLVLFLAIPAYVAAVSVMNTIYTHYFLPAVAMLPILLCAISQELDEGDGEREKWREVAIPLVAALAVCAVAAIFLATYSAPPTVSQNFYSRIYNFPQKNVWGATWPLMFVFTVAATIGIAAIRGFKLKLLEVVAWAAAAFVASSVVFAALPAAQLAPYMKKEAGEYLAPLAVSLATSAIFLVAIFGFNKRLPRRTISVFALPLCVIAMYLATPNWRGAFVELVRPGTHFHAETAKELAKLLPKDAIVIGERSNQMLMSLPIRTATTFAANSDPIPVIEAILKVEPDAKLYALADSQHAYNLQHYKEHAKEYALQPVKTFKMPSFGAGKPSDVYLCKIIKLRGAEQLRGAEPANQD